MSRRKPRNPDPKPRDSEASASGGGSVPRDARRSASRRGGLRSERRPADSEGGSLLSEIAPGLPAFLATLLLAGLPWAIAPGIETRDPGSDAKWLLLGWGVLAVAASALLARRFDPTPSPAAPPPPAAPPSAMPSPRALPVAAALIAVGIVASLALAPTPVAGARVAVRECMLVALALALASVRFTEAELRRLILACMVSAAGQAALTLWQFASPPPGAFGSGRSFMTGTFGNPEYVAGWLAPSLAAMVVAGALARGAGAVAARLLLAAGAALLGASIFVGGNRGAALGAAAGICFATRPWGLLGRPARASGVAAVSLAILAAIGAAVGAHLAMRPESRSHGLIGRGLATLDLDHVPTRHRIGLATITSRLIARDPIFGVGPGRFPLEFDRERGRAASGRDDLFDRDPGAPVAGAPDSAPDATPHLGFWRFGDLLSDAPAGEAHCDPLQWWAEYGIAPLLGLLLAVASALDRSREDVQESHRAPARLLLGAMLATLAVGSLFAFPLHRPARAALFWGLIGLLHAGRRASSDER